MQVLLLDTLETAPTIATSEMRAATTLLRLALLPLEAQNNRCVCVRDVVVVVTVFVVVLAMVFVVVVVVAAAVVVDVVLFGCESRSGAHRPCEWLQALSVGFAVAR